MSSIMLTACNGYRWNLDNDDSVLTGYHTITVPYVEGDIDGSITSAIIKQITSSGAFEYRREGGSIILQVVVLDYLNENIGFRYDRNSHNKIIKSTIPVETRTKIITEVRVVEAVSGRILLGPAKICASVEFDHDYYSSRNGINIFSLGQLSDIDEAQDAVQVPLDEKLAQKISSYLMDSW